MTIVRVGAFTGTGKTDKNGKSPVYLTYISGDALPENARVQSGTIAENSGLEIGNSYMVNVNPAEAYEGKAQFNVTVVAPVSGADLIALFSTQLSKQVKFSTGTTSTTSSEATGAQATAAATPSTEAAQ